MIATCPCNEYIAEFIDSPSTSHQVPAPSARLEPTCVYSTGTVPGTDRLLITIENEKYKIHEVVTDRNGIKQYLVAGCIL